MSLNHLTPCWCKMLGENKGKKINLDNAAHVRDGMGLCSTQCAEDYDSAATQRAEQQRRISAQFFDGMREHQRSRVGGEDSGRRKQRSFDVIGD